MVKAKVANPANRFAAGCLTIAFGGLWITLWSGVTLTIDGILVSSAVWHLLALGHPTVQGEVIESRVVEKSDSEGTSYQPLIRYRYTVARNEYVGDTSQGMALTLGGARDARRHLDRFPVGKPVPVYYNPRNPAQSVLDPGITSFHAFLALFLTPFNIVMLASWRVACEYFGIGWRRELPSGVRRWRTFDGQSIRLHGTPPLTCAAGTALGTAFIGIFIVAFGQMVLPPWPLLALVWSAVIGLTTWAYLSQRKRGRVLDLNDLRRTLVLHGKSGKTTELPFEAIARVNVRKASKSDGDGGRTETGGVLLSVRRKDDSSQRRMLVKGWSLADAEKLASWLRERLGLPEPHGDDEDVGQPTSAISA